MTPLARRALGEIIGTALLLAAVVGSGVAAQNLSSDVGLQLVRSSPGLWLGEVVATFGLLLIIFAVVRSGQTSAAPFAVGAYIGGAYFFTSSTSVAKPAATIARGLSDSFAGIAPSSAPAFVAAQLLGAALALVVAKALYPTVAGVAADAVLPHPTASDGQAPSTHELGRRSGATLQPAKQVR